MSAQRCSRLDASLVDIVVQASSCCYKVQSLVKNLALPHTTTICLVIVTFVAFVPGNLFISIYIVAYSLSGTPSHYHYSSSIWLQAPSSSWLLQAIPSNPLSPSLGLTSLVTQLPVGLDKYQAG